MRLFIIIAAALAISSPVFGQSASRMLTVTGDGRVSAQPDMAMVSLGVQSVGETADGALRDNSAVMQRIFGTLSEAGIAARDIQTGGLSLYPQFASYDRTSEGEAPTIIGYVASNSVNIRVTALDGLGAVLDSLGAAGVNQINGITFGLQNPEPVLDEARKAAVADARRKADLFATAAGVALGNVVTITEFGTGAPGPMPMARAEMAMDVPVAQGELDISAQVQVVYGLE
jgi:uncharacterized protein YggE